MCIFQTAFYKIKVNLDIQRKYQASCYKRKQEKGKCSFFKFYYLFIVNLLDIFHM